MPHGDDHWIVTYTGKKFWPLDPHVEDIDIIDISHSLSMLCRFTGHCLRFYSVAQHSVIVSSFCQQGATLDPELALWGLLHDAAEAYIGDMSRPLKMDDSYASGFRLIEACLMHKICEKFELPKQMPHEVKRLDNDLLIAEKEQIVRPNNHTWTQVQGTGVALPVTIPSWEPEVARYYFLSRFNQLCQMRQLKSATL